MTGGFRYMKQSILWRPQRARFRVLSFPGNKRAGQLVIDTKRSTRLSLEMYTQSFLFSFYVCVLSKSFKPGVQRYFSRTIDVIRLFNIFLTGTCENFHSLIDRSLTFGPRSLKEAINGVNRCFVF